VRAESRKEALEDQARVWASELESCLASRHIAISRRRANAGGDQVVVDITPEQDLAQNEAPGDAVFPILLLG
jgi:hypothetical protein